MVDVRHYSRYEVIRPVGLSSGITLVPGGDPIWVDSGAIPLQFSMDGGVTWKPLGSVEWFNNHLRVKTLVPVTGHYTATRDLVLLKGHKIIPKHSTIAVCPVELTFTLITRPEGETYTVPPKNVRERLAKGHLVPGKPPAPEPRQEATALQVVKALKKRPRLLAEVKVLLHPIWLVSRWTQDLNVLVRRCLSEPKQPVVLQVISVGGGPYEWSVKAFMSHVSSEAATLEAAKQAADDHLRSLEALNRLTAIFEEDLDE